MLTVDRARAEEFLARRRDETGATPTRTELLASTIRRDVVRMVARAQLGHIGGDFSVADILAVLYGAVLDVDPRHPDRPDRDRMILSKGHCAASLYSALARSGFFPPSELDTFAAPLSALNGHPDRTKVPGVETNTGPLGHGFPVGVGCALAARLRGASWRTVVVLGDGELQEGSNWEAAMTAAHHRLSSLLAVVDRNGLQQGARTEDTVTLEPLAEKWRSFGWEVREVDGHDHRALAEAFGPGRAGRPVCVLARTVKGRGGSFMEDRVEWHHKVPTGEQVDAILRELDGGPR